MYLFLFFYMFATVAVGAGRTTLFVERLQHASDTGLYLELHLEQSSPQKPVFPQFRQAKKNEKILNLGVKLTESLLERPVRHSQSAVLRILFPLASRSVDKPKPARSPPVM
jgi:hypothetical protein